MNDLSNYSTEELERELARRRQGLHKVVSLTQTCYACPSQWEGETEDGLHIYIRYRYGGLSVNIGKDEHFSSVGGNMDGMMDEAELKHHTKDILNWELYT